MTKATLAKLFLAGGLIAAISFLLTRCDWAARDAVPVPSATTYRPPFGSGLSVDGFAVLNVLRTSSPELLVRLISREEWNRLTRADMFNTMPHDGAPPEFPWSSYRNGVWSENSGPIPVPEGSVWRTSIDSPQSSAEDAIFEPPPMFKPVPVCGGWSPSRQYIAMVSTAEGRKGHVGMITGGRSSFRGRLYLEVFYSQSRDRVGPLFVLSGTSTPDTVDKLRLLWTNDDDFIVIHEHEYDRIWALDVKKDVLRQ